MTDTLHWDPLLIQRYNRPGPRYTSYPTAVEFCSVYNDSVEHQAFAARDPSKPLSLYLHIPFCSHVCYYCGCNKIVTKDQSKAPEYLQYLKREIQLKLQLLEQSSEGQQLIVKQLHLGGGTPTFLSDEQLADLILFVKQRFQFSQSNNADYSIEIDPRELRPSTLGVLRELGFNRVSFGVQDLNPLVQSAVNRIQPEDMIRSVVNNARALGFESINIDLIYGLPHQNRESFHETLNTIVELSPDRLSLFNYAHLPERFKPQRRIRSEDLPCAQEKLGILGHSIQLLTEAGYQYVGMDHFAKPDDELAVAQRKSLLHRNFQGYTTLGECDLIGFGVSSISQIGRYYLQNQISLDDYRQALDSDSLPNMKELKASDDDLIRRYVISELLCHRTIDLEEVGRKFEINSQQYLATSIAKLDPMVADGLVEVTKNRVSILPKGRLLARNLCMVFDEYLQQHEQQRFSKAI